MILHAMCMERSSMTALPKLICFGKDSTVCVMV